MNTTQLLAACALLAAGHAASSHVVLEQTRAPAGSSYRAVLRVGHGCDGLPTTGIAVKLPPGVQGAKPMPKPGWKIDLRSEALAAPVTVHGKSISADVAEITWTAMNQDAWLPDAYYDEFVLRATLPATPGPLWFQIVQTCNDNGRIVRKAWAQVPAEGVSTRGLPLPAALLQVEPANEDHSHH